VVPEKVTIESPGSTNVPVRSVVVPEICVIPIVPTVITPPTKVRPPACTLPASPSMTNVFEAAAEFMVNVVLAVSMQYSLMSQDS